MIDSSPSEGDASKELNAIGQLPTVIEQVPYMSIAVSVASTMPISSSDTYFTRNMLFKEILKN